MIGGNLSGDLLLADSKNLQELEGAEVYVRRFKGQEVFVTISYEFLVQMEPSGTLTAIIHCLPLVVTLRRKTTLDQM